MRLTPWIVLASLAACAPAAAEDFTGFYVGLNAGYGHGTGSDRSTIVPPTAASDAQAENALPPSAMSAADRMEARRPGQPRTGSPGAR